MYPTRTAPHPRAGVAVGLTIAAVWLGAFGVALATGEPADQQRADGAQRTDAGTIRVDR
jgi:hypothetical protein